MITETSPIAVRFEHLLNLISSEKFLTKQGLGNEVPFFICPYLPQEQTEIIRMEGQLIRRLALQGIPILHIDLYDLAIAMLKKRRIWERILEIEPQVSKEELRELLQNVLDTEKHLIPEIDKQMEENVFKVLFITGVGEVFPYIRSHNVLNNLQSIARDKPTILFFPGEYSQSAEGGASLDLFGKLHDDKYYRAFNIFDREI